MRSQTDTVIITERFQVSIGGACKDLHIRPGQRLRRTVEHGRICLVPVVENKKIDSFLVDSSVAKYHPKGPKTSAEWMKAIRPKEHA